MADQENLKINILRANEFHMGNSNGDLGVKMNLLPADVSEVLAEAETLVAADHGKTLFLNAAGGFTVTLPAVAAGLKFRFVVKTAPTTAYIITASSAIIHGSAACAEDGSAAASSASTAKTNINLVANQGEIGDFVDVECDGTLWYFQAVISVAAGLTVS